jgi:hypothetical protein
MLISDDAENEDVAVNSVLEAPSALGELTIWRPPMNGLGGIRHLSFVI